MPIFVEQTTRSQATGRLLEFRRRELEAIAKRCNRRVTETGDCAGICLGHIPGPSASGATMPEKVGEADAFKVGRFGDKWAILADLHIYREDLPRVKKYSRRSPELWLAQDYAEMFFDPICLLAAEVPRMDLGVMRFRLDESGRKREIFSAVCAGPQNVSTRSDKFAAASGLPQKPVRKPPMALSPEDVQEIVDALMQTEQMQWVKQKMLAESAPGEERPEPDSEAPPVAEPGPDAAPEPLVPPEPEAPGAPPETPPPPSPPVAPPSAPPAEDEDKEKSAMPMRYAKARATVETLTRRVAELEKAAQVERFGRVNAERRAALDSLSRQLQFDVDEEMGLCKAETGMTAEQFSKHQERMTRLYRPIPVDMMLTIPDVPAAPGAAPGAAPVEKFSKEIGEEILRLADAELVKGKNPDYDALKAQVLAKHGHTAKPATT